MAGSSFDFASSSFQVPTKGLAARADPHVNRSATKTIAFGFMAPMESAICSSVNAFSYVRRRRRTAAVTRSIVALWPIAAPLQGPELQRFILVRDRDRILREKAEFLDVLNTRRLRSRSWFG